MPSMAKKPMSEPREISPPVMKAANTPPTSAIGRARKTTDARRQLPNAACRSRKMPMALVGGVLAAFIRGGEISLGSLMGFFAILGIAARHAIATTGRYRHLERNEGEAFGPGLVLRGSRERFLPIVVSALVAAVALLPLVVMGNIPGLELVHPMAV